MIVVDIHAHSKKSRRNWFYEQFGLVFDYTDPEHREGRSRPMLAGALVKVETWKQNITEHRMLDYSRCPALLSPSSAIFPVLGVAGFASSNRLLGGIT